jgi:gas vesicle protein
MADDCKNGGSATVLLSFLVGAAIGGGLTLLLAPRSGQETREKLLNSGDEALDRLHALLGDAEHKLREPLDEIQELLRDKKEIFIAAVEAGKQAAKEKAEQKKPAKA